MDSDHAREEPRLSRPELDALLGVVATLHGHLMVGQLDHDLARALYQRLAPKPVSENATSHDLRQQLRDLGDALHYAMGSYDQPPPPEQVPPQDDDFPM